MKYWALGIGVVVSCIGLMCLPVGYGMNPRRDTSLFASFADMGVMFKVGLIILVVGLVIILLSLLIPKRD